MLFYPVLTGLVVVTANHYWSDGMVACVLVLVAAVLFRVDVPGGSVAATAPAARRAGLLA